MFRLLKRVTETAIKLPVAAAWDVISMNNMGEGSSTSKVLREHESQKEMDDLVEAARILRELRK